MTAASAAAVQRDRAATRAALEGGEKPPYLSATPWPLEIERLHARLGKGQLLSVREMQMLRRAAEGGPYPPEKGWQVTLTLILTLILTLTLPLPLPLALALTLTLSLTRAAAARTRGACAARTTPECA